MLKPAMKQLQQYQLAYTSNKLLLVGLLPAKIIAGIIVTGIKINRRCHEIDENPRQCLITSVNDTGD
jgi:hypothetical protein